MHYTVTIDVLDDNALELLRKLENLSVIRLRESTLQMKDTSAIRFLRGKMTSSQLRKLSGNLDDYAANEPSLFGIPILPSTIVNSSSLHMQGT